jgi:UDP-N-acetyl-D-mannosaminuronate dehydrogenase
MSYADPHVPSVAWNGRQHKAVVLTSETVTDADAIVILVNHPGWPLDEIARVGTPVFDAVNATAGLRADHIERL